MEILDELPKEKPLNPYLQKHHMDLIISRQGVSVAFACLHAPTADYHMPCYGNEAMDNGLDAFLDGFRPDDDQDYEDYPLESGDVILWGSGDVNEWEIFWRYTKPGE